MSIENIQKELKAQKEALERELATVTKQAERLAKGAEQFDSEPEVGTVLRFTRLIAGSRIAYTFVAARSKTGWYVTGSKNALGFLGLTERGNSWEKLLIAIADNEAEVASGWSPARGIGEKVSEPRTRYFQFQRGTRRRVYTAYPNGEIRFTGPDGFPQDMLSHDFKSVQALVDSPYTTEVSQA
jgi:hypothetical protein